MKQLQPRTKDTFCVGSSSVTTERTFDYIFIFYQTSDKTSFSYFQVQILVERNTFWAETIDIIVDELKFL